MEIPQNLKSAIELQIESINNNILQKHSENISNRYRNENNGEGNRLLTESNEAIAYSITRMPATYGAVYSVFKTIKELIEVNEKSVLDVGAGTGSACWAIDQLIEIKKLTCIEREKAMIDVAKNIMKNGSEILQNATWIKKDISKEDISEKADIVVTSYVLNELSDIDKNKYICKLYDATDEILVIVEPGTKAGFANILRAREILLAKGANICAPCTHNLKCPLEEADWCHFSCRVPRSKLHKQMKNAELSYEDEKYSYLVVSKKEMKIEGSRVIRFPQVYSGYTIINVCDVNGKKEIKYSKKDGEKYKQAKKLNWGDYIK